MDPIEQWLESGYRILIAPGWNNSCEEHWQSHWQVRYPQMQRIEQDDWQQPRAGQWGADLKTKSTRKTCQRFWSRTA